CNANPDSFECAIKVLEGTAADGKKFVAAGSMLELGDRAPGLHEKIGQAIAARDIDILITVGRLAEFIAKGALAAGMGRDRVFRAENSEAAAGVIRDLAGPSDVILIKGSRAAKMEGIIECFTMSCSR
ncbi:MAG: UDP-N-acetylmuramoyl-tripeptide--D-alanyl-D-alanine ligase, partial [Candidatus Omnitrophica bacterium]|nr:UDP-N-acetylmuramoyl-tripeptide--D-alanyl-D-alanine ligase [Candidatus Omnitrophota bacterium]